MKRINLEGIKKMSLEEVKRLASILPERATEKNGKFSRLNQVFEWDFCISFEVATYTDTLYYVHTISWFTTGAVLEEKTCYRTDKDFLTIRNERIRLK